MITKNIIFTAFIFNNHIPNPLIPHPNLPSDQSHEVAQQLTTEEASLPASLGISIKRQLFKWFQ